MARDQDKTDLLGQLDQLVIDLLLESNNSRYSDNEQNRIHENAMAVRRRKVRLDSMAFDQATAGYQAVKAALQDIESTIHTRIGRIDDLVSFLGNLAKAATALDGLISVAKPV